MQRVQRRNLRFTVRDVTINGVQGSLVTSLKQDFQHDVLHAILQIEQAMLPILVSGSYTTRLSMCTYLVTKRDALGERRLSLHQVLRLLEEYSGISQPHPGLLAWGESATL